MKYLKMVVIEGVDGVGKTTLAKKLEEDVGYKYVYTPQAPFISIRREIEKMKDINSRFFYYMASVVAVQKELSKLIQEGRKIVIDRYIYSTFAMHTVLRANTSCVIMKKLPIFWPDVGILLTATQEIRKLRREKSVNDQKHTQKIECQMGAAQEIYKSFGDLIELDTSNLDETQVFNQTMKLLSACS